MHTNYMRDFCEKDLWALSWDGMLNRTHRGQKEQLLRRVQTRPETPQQLVRKDP